MVGTWLPRPEARGGDSPRAPNTAVPPTRAEHWGVPSQQHGVLQQPTDRSRPSLPFTTYPAAQLSPSLSTLPHCLTTWLSTQKSKMQKGKTSCSFVCIFFSLNVRSVFLQVFSFCQETISQKCCEFMGVSKVAWRPLLKENDITFVPTGCWKKLSLHFLNGEHRPYHARLASASPAAN